MSTFELIVYILAVVFGTYAVYLVFFKAGKK